MKINTLDSQIYIGIMSGTSLDGVDVAAVTFQPKDPTIKMQMLAQATYPFPPELKNAVLSIANNQAVDIQKMGELDHRLGILFADCVLAFLAEHSLTSEEIVAIGSHGQTVFHQPTGAYPFTWQFGDPSLIAAKTQIVTVADFRRKDMAYGGQGAPLVPAFHQFLFANPHQTRIILNIGGIANLTLLAPEQDVIGFDTGTGNLLMDAGIARHHTLAFDENGRWAGQGKAIPKLLDSLLDDPYFSLPIPKSTGREYFNLTWLDKKLDAYYSSNAYLPVSPCDPVDVQATLLAFTCQSIATAVSAYGSGELIVCGGGANNPQLMRQLEQRLPRWRLLKTEDIGVDGDALEAMAFAWLAKQTIEGKSGNLPSATGASRACRLGGIYYPD